MFGCVAHMKIPSIHTSKLDDRSRDVIHLGKEPGTKAYRLYDPETNKVHVNRDDIFEEKKVWPWKQQEGNNVSRQEFFTVIGSSTV